MEGSVSGLACRHLLSKKALRGVGRRGGQEPHGGHQGAQARRARGPVTKGAGASSGRRPGGAVGGCVGSGRPWAQGLHHSCVTPTSQRKALGAEATPKSPATPSTAAPGGRPPCRLPLGLCDNHPAPAGPTGHWWGLGGGLYLAVGSANRGVQDEVGRGDHVHQGHRLIFQLSENQVHALSSAPRLRGYHRAASPGTRCPPTSDGGPGPRPDAQGSVPSPAWLQGPLRL